MRKGERKAKGMILLVFRDWGSPREGHCILSFKAILHKDRCIATGVLPDLGLTPC